ncbi:hypothetical protein EDF50_2292 [Frigoribacterium sp. PhB24]|nr:hypothetical protein EDF50_2292 [Frigoribacterium sp. PhB24]
MPASAAEWRPDRRRTVLTISNLTCHASVHVSTGGTIHSEGTKKFMSAHKRIATTGLTIGGSYYGMGQAAGERSYHAGLRNAEYQRVTWQVRSLALTACGAVGGPVFMTGFENKFYSMIRR